MNPTRFVKLADAETIRSVDEAAMTGYGITGLQLMENAGRGVADAVKGELLRMGGRYTGTKVSIVAGKGNNGGDGFVAARHLKNSGLDPVVFLTARPGDLTGDARANHLSWKKMGGVTRAVRSAKAFEKYSSFLRHSAVVVDCIFGTGLKSEVRGFYGDVLNYINGLGKPVVAVDVPSGIDATTGAVLGAAVRASVTATMAMPKLGLYIYPGRAHTGRVEVVDIGAPAELTRNPRLRWNLVTDRSVAGTLMPREADSHKGTYGHVVVAGGSPGKGGAAVMAAEGGMRTGAGFATIAHPAGMTPAMEAKTTEVMTLGLADTESGTLGARSLEALLGFATDKSVIVAGPGLGANDDTERFMEGLFRKTPLPLVVDADGLNSITRPAVIKKTGGEVVLTPHPGEMSRLLGISTAEVQADRVGSAVSLSKKTGAVVVLKGASTITATPDGEVYVNTTGNPVLATAGTGDVLAGMIGGLMAQGYQATDAAVAAVYAHGLAADELARRSGPAGSVATDLLPVIPATLERLRTNGGGGI